MHNWTQIKNTVPFTITQRKKMKIHNTDEINQKRFNKWRDILSSWTGKLNKEANPPPNYRKV